MKATKRGYATLHDAMRRDATRRDASVAVRTLRIVAYGSVSLTKVKPLPPARFTSHSYI